MAAVKKCREQVFHSDELILKVMKATMSGKYVRDVSLKYEMKIKTIRNYLDKFRGMNLEQIKHKLINKKTGMQVFTHDSDKEVASLILQSPSPMLDIDIRKLAYSVAKRHNLLTPKRWVREEAAGLSWFSNFIKRHPELKKKAISIPELKKATAFIKKQRMEEERRRKKAEVMLQKPSSNSRYDNQTIYKALKEVFLYNRQVREVALELGIKRESLYNFVRKYTNLEFWTIENMLLNGTSD